MKPNHQGEADVVAKSIGPVTGPSLMKDLQAVGLRQGDLVLCHSALSRLGWVVGGAQTVLGAVREVLGQTGTLVMPGFSSQLSYPTDWENPPIPGDWHETTLDNMPIFDPAATPSRGLGRLPEAFRALPDTARSHHPIDSFLANGPMARQIIKDHPLSPTFGPGGPLGKLYANDAKVLFLGSGFDTCTAFHLAEYDNPNASWSQTRYPVERLQEKTQWKTVQELDFQSELFGQIGAEFMDQTQLVQSSGPMMLFAMTQAVEFAKS